MYKGVIPFIALQLVGLAIVGVNPSLVNYLPTKTFLSSETAPPPKNPRLQLCLEDYLFDFYNSNENNFLEQVVLLREVDYSSLPKSQEKTLRQSVNNAEKIYEKIDAVEVAKEAIASAAPEYAPVLSQVRTLNDSSNKSKSKTKS